MKMFFERMLKTFDYHSYRELMLSIYPAGKYQLTSYGVFISLLAAGVDRVFGLDAFAFAALLVVFVTELASGIAASRIRKEPISSMKLSRFSFKVAYYMVLIAVPYLFFVSFNNKDRTVVAACFNWLHSFLVVQIVLENMVSILENIAVISGKDKTHIITKIQDKISQLLQ